MQWPERHAHAAREKTTTMASCMPLLVTFSFAPTKSSDLGAFANDFPVRAASVSIYHIGTDSYVDVYAISTTDT